MLHQTSDRNIVLITLQYICLTVKVTVQIEFYTRYKTFDHLIKYHTLPYIESLGGSLKGQFCHIMTFTFRFFRYMCCQ